MNTIHSIGLGRRRTILQDFCPAHREQQFDHYTAVRDGAFDQPCHADVLLEIANGDDDG